jgi:ATP-dependent Lon protease
LLELSQKLGTLFHSVDCASVTNGFDLTGMSAKWNGSSSGKLHDLLFNHECPNPIILLDEVEKASGTTSSPFINTLYGLLEKNNAKHFRDEFVQVRMDASLVNWFATSNYADRLDAPIRDRFQVLEVKAPSTEDLKLIIPKLYKKMIQEDGLEKIFTVQLGKDVIEKLALMDGISLRRINASLSEALSNAVERLGYDRKTKRKVKLQVSDIPDTEMANENKSNPIGYIWG